MQYSEDPLPQQREQQAQSCCPVMPVGYMIILIAIGLSPCVAVAIGLWAADSIILAFVLFHYVFALAIPIILLYKVDYFKEYRDSVRCGLVVKPKTKSSLIIGSIVFVVCSGGLLLLFYLASPSIDLEYIRNAIEDLGIHQGDEGIIIFFFIYFNVINPLIQEFFWRRFILKGFPDSQGYRWLDSFMYGLYHMFVIAKFTSWGFGALLAAMLVIVGRIFIFLQTWKDGFVGLLAHVGGDLGISFILLGVLYEWFS